MFWEFVQALFLFVMVLALAWVSTRFVAVKMGAPARGRLVRVLEHVPAGRDRSIMLLEVGGRIYLVGATGEQIRLLDRIEDGDVIQRIMDAVPAAPENPLGDLLPGSFKEILGRVRGAAPPAAANPAGTAEDEDDAELTGDQADRLKEQIERLRRLQKQ